MSHLPIVLFIFYLATINCKIPPSPDFNLTDFIGEWNAVGIYNSEKSLNLAFYSCATYNVTLGTLSRLTLELSYIDTQQNAFVTQTSTVIPSPLNKANLISTTNPGPENNLVVTYYSVDDGEAIIINGAGTLGVILARNENPLNNDFQAMASQYLVTNLSLSSDNITYVFNRACDYQTYKPLANFDPSSLASTYYGNALYQVYGPSQDTQCFTIGAQEQENLYNISTNFTYQNGKIIVTSLTYLPLPGTPGVLMPTQIRNLAPYVFIYADQGSNTFVAISGDGLRGYVFSAEPTLSSDVLNQVEQAFNENGLPVSEKTFYVLNSTCGTDIKHTEEIEF